MENHKLFTTTILILFAISGLYYFTMGRERVEISEINSYQECADAGYPIMESYPEQCATPDGRSFTRILDDSEVIVPPPAGGDDEVVFCTQDAMQCPDGSWVGRTGPRCEFVCPLEPTSGIQGTVWLGPTCPVVQNPPDPQCDDRVFQTSLALYSSDGMLIKSFNSEADGTFRISAAPGKYKIGPVSGRITMPSCQETGVIEVKKNLYTQTEVQCDSGIR